MKINTTKKSKKLVIILVSIVVAIAAISTALLIYSKQKNNPESSTSSVEPQRSESDEQQSRNIDTNPDVKESTPNTDSPASPSINPTTGKKNVSMVTSVDVSGGIVSIRGGVNSLVPDSGTCFVVITGPSNKSVSKETTILQNAASSDCRTITIPISELGTGTWRYTLSYQEASYEGKTNEVSFEI